jgi:hypothetical protein
MELIQRTTGKGGAMRNTVPWAEIWILATLRRSMRKPMNGVDLTGDIGYARLDMV